MNKMGILTILSIIFVPGMLSLWIMTKLIAIAKKFTRPSLTTKE